MKKRTFQSDLRHFVQNKLFLLAKIDTVGITFIAFMTWLSPGHNF